MTASFTLARIAGIRIGINWTRLIVFALITWSWATQIFPDQNPASATARTSRWRSSPLSSSFSRSCSTRKLGHAIQARRDGMEIEGDHALWLFGGVAQFKGTFPSAGAGFRIAGAGVPRDRHLLRAPCGRPPATR